MRVITVLLILAAVALSVYNTLETRRLREQVTALQLKVGAAGSAEKSDIERAKELVRQAQEHAARGDALLKKGDLTGARREWQQSTDLVAEAARVGADESMIAQVRERFSEIVAPVKEKLQSRRGPAAQPPAESADAPKRR